MAQINALDSGKCKSYLERYLFVESGECRFDRGAHAAISWMPFGN